MLFARASLKPARPECRWHRRSGSRLSRAFCAGLIEAPRRPAFLVLRGLASPIQLSRAFCAGLIEASCSVDTLPVGRRRRWQLSRAFCAGLIEATAGVATNFAQRALSRAFCAGLIEARNRRFGLPAWTVVMGYPVLFARASLKPPPSPSTPGTTAGLSRAFCAGLIEAFILQRPYVRIMCVIPCFLRGPH